jgi:hypothetical protein
MKRIPYGEMDGVTIERYCRPIPYFSGVFPRNLVPKRKRGVKFMCFVYNLDDGRSSGTHWTAFVYYDGKCLFFDSFGGLKPTQELIRRFGANILYNERKFQRFNTSSCGRWSIKFLWHIYLRYYKKQRKIDNKVYDF